MRILKSLQTVSLLSLLCLSCPDLLAGKKPNVILVTIDDLNDWIEPLGGHPNAKTPEITKFCKSGAIVFRNSVCPAPVCGPSRSSFLSGYMPHRTGVYDNATNMLDSELVQKNPTLPEFFGSNGYYTLSTGKVFHSHRSENGDDKGQWAFQNYFASKLWDHPDPAKVTESKSNKIDGKTPNPIAYKQWKKTKGMQWGPSLDPKYENTADYAKVEWANKYLSGNRELKEPFFMSLGIYKPHVPWYVPQEFFDLHPLDSIKAPHVNPNDLDDIKRPNGKNTHRPQKDYQWVKAYGLEKKATQGYLAAMSEADKTLGVLLDQLAKSPYAENTIVIVMGDHGWHLGEKHRYHKNTLWAEAVKTPLMVRVPKSVAPEGKFTYCENPVSLIDVYPTLIELCGLDKKEDLDGNSFAKMLKDPAVDHSTVGITVSTNGASILSTRWHYIENRSKGHENIYGGEMYDLKNDPYEESNLIDSKDPEVVAAITAMKEHLPKSYAPSVKVQRKRGKRGLDSTIKPTRKDLDYFKPRK